MIEAANARRWSRRRAAALAGVSLAVVLATAACRQSPNNDSGAPQGEPARAAAGTPAGMAHQQRTTTVESLVLPDISALAPRVQEQLRAADAARLAALTPPGATAEGRAAAYGTVGRLLLAAGFAPEAVVAYRQAAEWRPDEERWHYLLGHALMRAGDRPGARAAFERALALQPQHLNAVFWLGETLLDAGESAIAQQMFARAIAINGESAAAHFGLGRASLALRQFDTAIDALTKALSLDGRATAIHYPLAMAYRGRGDADRAAEHLRLRGGIYPTLDDPLMQSDTEVLESGVSFESRGMDALRRADFAQAVALFRRGLDIAPADSSLRYWLGSALYASGDAPGARRAFQQVLAAEPAHAKAHFSLGAIAEASGQAADALTHYRAAVQSDPTLLDAHVRLADALSRAGQRAAAVDEYERAIALDPTTLSAWVGGARALVALNRAPDARQWLERARRVHPTSPELATLQRDVLARLPQ